MNAPAQINRPAPLCYYEGEPNRCPQCQNKSWHVGRVTAECAHCGHPLPLAHFALSARPADQDCPINQ